GAGGDLRRAHLVLNLLGLVGLVIGGTLPFFAATEARTRMSPRATAGPLAVLGAWQVLAVVVAAAGLAADHRVAAAAGLGGYAAGLVALAGVLPAVRSKQL